MEEIHVFTPVCLADLEKAEDRLYSLRQLTKDQNRLKGIDKELMNIERKFRDFHASLPTA